MVPTYDPAVVYGDVRTWTIRRILLDTSRYIGGELLAAGIAFGGA